jgi:hypothetical protein
MAPPVVFQQCRSLGHEWRHMDHEIHNSEIVKRSVCADCGMQRFKRISRAGYLMPTRYIPPEGYSQHGDDRLPNHEWRSLYVESLFAPHSTNGKKKK